MSITMRRCSISFLSQRRLSTAAAAASPLSSPAPSEPSLSPRNPISILKASTRAESDPEKILALLQSSTHLPGFYEDRFVHQFCVQKIARSKRLDLVERLLEFQKSDPAAPKTEDFYIRIMSLYTKASMPDHALRTFEQIPSRTESSLCALLTAYLKHKQHDRVRELFDSIPTQYGIVPHVASYNILLASLCYSGDLHAARKMLDEMLVKKEVKPNIGSYNTLLSAYFKSGDEIGFDDIIQEINSKAVDHNIVTYNLRILNLCQKKESRKAEELLDELVSKGLQPNPTTFGALIKGFCNEGDVDSAMRVYKKTKEEKNENRRKKFSPTPGIYVALLRALVAKGNFTSAVPICKDCLSKDFIPPFGVMKTLVNELVKDSKTEKAKALVDMMRKVSSKCAADSWAKIEAELPL